MTEWQSIVSTGIIQNSYGSFVRSGRRVPQEMTQHFVESADTLQGISLKYGINMEELRRINKLHYTDSIQTRQFLNIPVAKGNNNKHPLNQTDENVVTTARNPSVERKEGTTVKSKIAQENRNEVATMEEKESTVHDFLQKLDMQISSRKERTSSMLSDGEYKLPNSAYTSSARYTRKPMYENSVETTFSNPQSYHSQTDELYRL